MFFTPELLARRDSGFGLLWLAATLGSKSVFKKLPRRSVMTADIAQLCSLIAEPTEPLALRLSSNLMYGVVRVYKVKQELFITDVNTCVTSLRKMMQEMHHYAASDSDLLMAQPTARLHAVTIQHDPATAHALMFDTLFSGWGDDAEDGNSPPILKNTPSQKTHTEAELTLDDGEYDPRNKAKKKERARPAKESMIETARRDTYILSEHHDHLFSASLDKSFEGGPSALEPSSSQFGGGFVLEDDFLGISDDFDLAGGLGDELAKELGWEMNEAPADRPNDMMNFDIPGGEFDTDIDFADANLGFDAMQPGSESAFIVSTPIRSPKKSQRKNNKENKLTIDCGNSNRGSSVTSFSRAFLSQDQIDDDNGRRPLAELTAENQQINKPERKRKRARLLLDARTELTDEELRVARAKYLESQKELHKELVQKKLEKGASKLIDGLIWGAPRGVRADPLVQFWRDNFKVQVQARTNIIDIHPEPRNKRARKEQAPATKNIVGDVSTSPPGGLQDFDMGFYTEQGNFELFDGGDAGEAQRRSSEEPGQGRQRSQRSSVVRESQFGIELEPREPGRSGSQKSMFPWDHAGASSSAGGPIFDDNIDFAHVDVRLRSSSMSRKGSPSQRRSRSGSVLAGISGVSPAPIGQGSQIFGENLVLDESIGGCADDSRGAEVALLTLEKNSFNFLEYAKMQYQATASGELRFDTIVPNATSTRHVASAAFYHCLVLATKNLVSLKQEEAYGSIIVSIV